VNATGHYWLTTPIAEGQAMRYRIKAEQTNWYLVRETRQSVMTIVHRKAKDFPVGQEFEIFEEGKLIATCRRHGIFDDLLIEAGVSDLEQLPWQ
jgi:hypothetical protein